MVYKSLCFFIVFFIACKSPETPRNVLPVNEMKQVLWDIIQADEYANLFTLKDSTKNLKEETLKLYSKVFFLHNISADDFGKSYEFYKTHPVMEKKLLDSLQAYGNKTKEANYQKPRLSLPALPVNDTSLKN